MKLTRRSVTLAAVVPFLALASGAWADRQQPTRIVIWDERQPAQKQVYTNFLGNEIAEFLRKSGGDDFEITSVGLDEAEHGLPADLLNNTDILIWWGHQRHGEVPVDLAKAIVNRVASGKMSFIGLHSTHWSKPFTMLMDARAISDAKKTLTVEERKNFELKTVPAVKKMDVKGEKKTPYSSKSVNSEGKTILEVHLPVCCFWTVSADGKPSHITTLAPSHPIAKGIPGKFDIPHTEIYGGEFSVPEPDVRIFGEKWDDGQEFAAGNLWKVGKGQVFYYRPGHEIYPVFKQKENLNIILNTVRFMSRK